MSKRKTVSNLLVVRGQSKLLREFRRTAFESNGNPLSFLNIRPSEYFGDWKLEEQNMNSIYGIHEFPKTVKILEESDQFIKYFFRSKGVCNADFMSEKFPALIFEHAYVVFENKGKTRLEHGFQIRRGDDLRFHVRSRAPERDPSKELGSAAYLMEMIREYNHEDDFEPVIPEPLEYPLWTSEIRGRTAMFIASHHKLEPVSLMFPYDLIILNDTQDEPRNNPGLIGMKRISEKVVRVQAKPVRVIRALSDLNIRVKCFIGLAAGYSWSMMNYNGNIDMPGFFEFLSHVLCDEALYLADFDFVSHLLKGERYRFDQHDFPVANFSALPLEKDSVPFNIGVLPLTTEDFDDLPGADEPCIDENVPDPQRLRIFGLKKLPADTQTFVLGNIEVSLSNATVWDFETDFDCVVANPAPREMTEAFLPAKGKRDYIVNLDWFMKRPFVKFLEEADLEKWSSVGIGISMEKQFRPALMALKKWNKEFPKRVHFFVIDPAEKQNASAILMKNTG